MILKDCAKNFETFVGTQLIRRIKIELSLNKYFMNDFITCVLPALDKWGFASRALYFVFLFTWKFLLQKRKKHYWFKGWESFSQIKYSARLILRVSQHVQFFAVIVSGAKQAFSISFLQVFLSKVDVKMTLAIGNKLKLDIMYLLTPMFSTAF